MKRKNRRYRKSPSNVFQQLFSRFSHPRSFLEKYERKNFTARPENFCLSWSTIIIFLSGGATRERANVRRYRYETRARGSPFWPEIRSSGWSLAGSLVIRGDRKPGRKISFATIRDTYGEFIRGKAGRVCGPACSSPSEFPQQFYRCAIRHARLLLRLPLVLQTSQWGTGIMSDTIGTIVRMKVYREWHAFRHIRREKLVGESLKLKWKRVKWKTV